MPTGCESGREFDATEKVRHRRFAFLARSLIDLKHIGMRVGIDFDNTIVSYDEVMLRTAVEWGLVDSERAKGKKQVRDHLRNLPDGESHWRRLQTFAYGEGMAQAVPHRGVMDFLAYCRSRGIPLWIVSHKTEFNNFGPPSVNLREVAREWLSRQGFFNEGVTGLTSERVYFESTREEKVARITMLSPSYFIDDLEETFQEPGYPVSVGKIHYLPNHSHSTIGDAFHAETWTQILDFIRSKQESPHATGM